VSVGWIQLSVAAFLDLVPRLVLRTELKGCKLELFLASREEDRYAVGSVRKGSSQLLNSLSPSEVRSLYWTQLRTETDSVPKHCVLFRTVNRG
jgi:hypothetical protein